MVLAVRFTDRVGKGIRTAPRDALIADSVAVTERGKSFGFHRAADSAGAMLGLTLSALIIYMEQAGTFELTREAFQTMVLVGIIPGFLAVFLLIALVREIAAPRYDHVQPPSLTLKGFDSQFKVFLLIIVLFTLGNSSDAFLLLRAQNLGLSVLEISIILIFFNLIYTAISYPAGSLSDRIGRKRVIVAGWAVYALIYLGFGAATDVWQVWLLWIFYGVYYGAVEGAAKAFVADVVPSAQRGTAYGVYAAAVGVFAFPASVIAGLLWENVSPAAPFYFGAALAGIAMLLLWVFIKSNVRGSDNRAGVKRGITGVEPYAIQQNKRAQDIGGVVAVPLCRPGGRGKPVHRNTWFNC